MIGQEQNHTLVGRSAGPGYALRWAGGGRTTTLTLGARVLGLSVPQIASANGPALQHRRDADLAAGHDRVVAISCFPLSLPEGGSDATFSAWAALQAVELNTVRERGMAVEVIAPGAEFLALSGGGANLSDVGRASEAYEVGIRQARLELDRIRVVWNGKRRRQACEIVRSAAFVARARAGASLTDGRAPAPRTRHQ